MKLTIDRDRMALFDFIEALRDAIKKAPQLSTDSRTALDTSLRVANEYVEQTDIQLSIDVQSTCDVSLAMTIDKLQGALSTREDAIHRGAVCSILEVTRQLADAFDDML